jgi:hypothetical protein
MLLIGLSFFLNIFSLSTIIILAYSSALLSSSMT